MLPNSFLIDSGPGQICFIGTSFGVYGFSPSVQTRRLPEMRSRNYGSTKRRLREVLGVIAGR